MIYSDTQTRTRTFLTQPITNDKNVVEKRLSTLKSTYIYAIYCAQRTKVVNPPLCRRSRGGNTTSFAQSKLDPLKELC